MRPEKHVCFITLLGRIEHTLKTQHASQMLSKADLLCLFFSCKAAVITQWWFDKSLRVGQPRMERQSELEDTPEGKCQDCLAGRIKSWVIYDTEVSQSNWCFEICIRTAGLIWVFQTKKMDGCTGNLRSHGKTGSSVAQTLSKRLISSGTGMCSTDNDKKRSHYSGMRAVVALKRCLLMYCFQI